MALMRLAFIDIATSYHAASPFEGPLGGTQAAVCYLSVELAKRGVDVTLINQHRETGATLGVHNLSPDALDDEAALQNFSHIIFNGRWTEKLVKTIRARTKAALIGWMHEACFQSPYILPLAEFNALVFVSEWQKKLNAALIPAASRSIVIQNGIAPDFASLSPLPPGGDQGEGRWQPMQSTSHEISPAPPGGRGEKASPPIAIYAGSSKRGLTHLPAIIPLIHAAHPQLQFEIYSDAVVASNEEENRAFRERLRALPNVRHLGSVDQKTLPQRMARATYLLSPNAYPETFCIVLAESMAAGLRIITTARAALPETANGFAALMALDHPDDPNWLPDDLNSESFAAFANNYITQWQILTEPEKNKFLQTQSAFAKARYNWATHAESWQGFLGTLAR